MLSLIIPVYLNEDSLPELLEVVNSLHVSLKGKIEIIFVVDGSPDKSYELLRDQLPNCAFSSQLILLSRNFGSFAALRSGLELASGEIFAVMAADLQEPPELILQMNDLLRQDMADVVLAVRETRSDPFWSKTTSNIFWWLYRRYVVPDMPAGGVDVFACNQNFRATLLKMEERHSSLIAQIFWLGFRRKHISYIRAARRHGKSAWTFKKKVGYLTDSVFAFTDLPIKLLTRVGAIGAMLAAMFGCAVVTARLLGSVPVAGYAMTIIMIVFFGAINLLGLGVVGSYAWRAYENTKQRPLSVRLKVQKFPHSEKDSSND